MNHPLEEILRNILVEREKPAFALPELIIRMQNWELVLPTSNSRFNPKALKEIATSEF
ncbi:MAG: hypothetical protein IPG90_03835 [Bacteroidetes bacterium]|nr:hypothetical protein [Bacteroidota bacterium]